MQLTPVALNVVCMGMERYPLNIVNLMDMFPSEEACLKYLAGIRWPEGYRCLRCGSAAHWVKAHGIYECRDCGYQGSVTRGTLFQDTHKPLRLWFQAIWYVVHQQNGMSALGLQRTLGLGSYHTAWEWLHKLRRAMVRPNRDKLAGIVEVDETFIGGERPGKRGRGAEGKVFVFIAVEDTGKGIGRIRLSTLEDASSESLSAATLRAVNVGSTVHSDGWEAYNALSMHGYTHVPIMHKNAKSGDATPLAHMVAYFTLPGVAHALCGAYLLR